MPNTPAVDPPIVTRDDARLLVHEMALSAILGGMKKVLPQLFLYGSFNVDPLYKREPIHIPNPTGGPDIVLNYRADFDNFAIDIAPSDVTVGSFPDPFNLDPGTVALHAQATIDLAGNPISAWQVRVSMQVWLKCKVSFGSDGWLTFQLSDAMIHIDQMMNTGWIAALNNIIHDYLHTVILQLRLPISPLAGSQWISISPTALSLQLDAADLNFKITVQ